MRRVARAILNSLTALSLVLGVVVAALWIRGYWWYDDLGVVTTYQTPDYRRNRQYQFGSQVGGITWTITTYEWKTPTAVARAHMPEGTRFWRNELEANPRPYFIVASDRFGGFNVARDSHTPRDPGRSYSFYKWGVRTPMWFVLLLVSSPTLVRFVALGFAHVRRTRRRVAGLCPLCGYDLCASPERCSECGAVTAKPAAA